MGDGIQMKPAMGSSDVASYGYDEDEQVLVVEFNSGYTYAYQGVPRPVYDAFDQAGSKGQFVHGVLKHGYPAVRM